ncbi:MAG: DNA methyltransferase, partial [Sulfobacillus sp.]
NLCTEPNDWIWDPMAGSGTTLVAAITEGRNVFGGDNNPQALSLMQQRLNDLSASHRQLTF